jgi:hypothetical protein
MDSIPGYSPLYGANLLTDGDCEAVGVAAWTAINSADLTKETGSPHSGSQVLRVAYDGVGVPCAQQVGTTVGDTFLYRGWARGDGTFRPELRKQNTLYWQGTPSTDWQYFSVIDTSAVNNVRYCSSATAAGYAEFDDLSVWAYTKDVKVIECITDGVIYVPTSQLRQTPTQAAYGEWEWWFNHAADSTTRALIVASDPVTASSLGYNVDIRSNEQFALRRSDVASLMVSALDYVTVGEWHKLRMTRSYLGAFTAYLDDTLIDLSGGGGTNPTTDNTVITSQYSVFELDAGDKIAFSDVTGNHSIWKGLLG